MTTTSTRKSQQHQQRSVVRSRRSSEGSSSNPKTIHVIAPATLAEGYTFDVDVSGKTIRVTVPPGGVEQGEEFEFQLPSKVATEPATKKERMITNNNNAVRKESLTKTEKHGPSQYPHDEEEDCLEAKPTASSSDDDTQHDTLGAPVGRWRNHLCACCDVLTQATFWMALCCAPVLIAQILTRLGLNWKGTKASAEEASLTFNRIVMGFIGVLIIGNIPIVGYVATFLYTMVLLAWTGRNLRRTMRQRYHIPASVHEKVDDCLCMICCGCCSAIQMARHTHDDKEYPGSCCTTTGLDLDAPHLV